MSYAFDSVNSSVALLFFWPPSRDSFMFFFFQAEDGIRDHCVTGVQTCALPISTRRPRDHRREAMAANASRQTLQGAVRPERAEAALAKLLQVRRRGNAAGPAR